MNFHFSLDLVVQSSKKPLHTVGNEDWNQSRRGDAL